jgi:hypothetical protein
MAARKSSRLLAQQLTLSTQPAKRARTEEACSIIENPKSSEGCPAPPGKVLPPSTPQTTPHKPKAKTPAHVQRLKLQPIIPGQSFSPTRPSAWSAVKGSTYPLLYALK